MGCRFYEKKTSLINYMVALKYERVLIRDRNPTKWKGSMKANISIESLVITACSGMFLLVMFVISNVRRISNEYNLWL